MEYRIETDSMGEVQVPSWAYYGAQTQRAVDNFNISDLVMPMEVVRALALIKWAAAKTNAALGLLKPEIAEAIANAALEIAEGRVAKEHFPVDVFQTGSGTSTNMNVNEVIANLANVALGGKMGAKSPVHPNDHVNKGQSSNDTIPTAIHVAAVLALDRQTIPALVELQKALAKKAEEFDDVLKIGRTHLQDATPIRLGQEFSGYARQVELGVQRLNEAREHLLELALGGTAVGTGVNTHPQFAKETIARLAEKTGAPFREAENHFEAQAAKDAIVYASGALKTVATSLMKIANDIRWLGSGPRCGLGEIILPELQPGSSIMPGKVNPVIPEAVIQVAAQVTGNDLAITIGGQWGNFELNVMMPVMAHNLLQSISLVGAAARAFKVKCIDGIQADRKRCESMIEQSLAMCTPLAKVIGYDRAAEIAKEAYQTGRTVREIAREKGVLPEEELAKVLDPSGMTRPSA